MRIIDSHVHLGSKSYSNLISEDSENLLFRLKNEAEDFIKLMNQNGIDKSIVFGIPHKDIDVNDTNNYIFEAYLKYKDRFIPFCRINENLEKNLILGFEGAKVHLLYENLNIENIKEYCQTLEYYKKPLIVHALFNNKVEQIKSILNYAPKLNIILAHMGRKELYTMNGVLKVLKGLKQFPNVYFDTSTVGTAIAIEQAVNIVGNNRIFYGSDYPIGLIYSNELSIVLNSKLRDFEKENILSRNIENLLKR